MRPRRRRSRTYRWASLHRWSDSRLRRPADCCRRTSTRRERRSRERGGAAGDDGTASRNRSKNAITPATAIRYSRSMRSWAPLVVLVAAGAALHCVGEDPEPTAAPDAGSDAPSDDASPGSCATIYVAGSGGRDTNDGCAREAPKQTIVSALRSARDHAATKLA